MYSAAIIVFTYSTLPKILNFFIVPRIEHAIDFNISQDKFRIVVINCPYSGIRSRDLRISKALRNLCLNNNICYTVADYDNNNKEKGFVYLEESTEAGNLNEIKAIKWLSALIKLSYEKNKNMLKENMGFICGYLDYELINTVSEEAAGIMIYEHDKLDIEEKNRVFELLMTGKGISSVFTKQLSVIIRECGVLYIDESIELSSFKSELRGKLIIGNNTVEGDFIKIKDVLLWFEELKDCTQNNLKVRYNNEILTVLRHFYRDRNTIEFIKRFPHIYMSEV